MIYNNIAMDVKLLRKLRRDNGVEIVHPQKTFFQIIQRKGFPSRIARFCYSELKEYKILDNSIQGIRRYESHKRAERYKEPIICRMYSKKGYVNTILPILDWTLPRCTRAEKRKRKRIRPYICPYGKSIEPDNITQQIKKARIISIKQQREKR